VERKLDVSREDLACSFRKALEFDDDKFDQNALSTTEIADLLNISRTKASKLISRAVEEGRIERARKRVHTSDGRYAPVPAYRVVKDDDTDVDVDARREAEMPHIG